VATDIWALKVRHASYKGVEIFLANLRNGFLAYRIFLPAISKNGKNGAVHHRLISLVRAHTEHLNLSQIIKEMQEGGAESPLEKMDQKSEQKST
jgi:hypothetical protein